MISWSPMASGVWDGIPVAKGLPQEQGHGESAERPAGSVGFVGFMGQPESPTLLIMLSLWTNSSLCPAAPENHVCSELGTACSEQTPVPRRCQLAPFLWIPAFCGKGAWDAAVEGAGGTRLPVGRSCAEETALGSLEAGTMLRGRILGRPESLWWQSLESQASRLLPLAAPTP